MKKIRSFGIQAMKNEKLTFMSQDKYKLKWPSEVPEKCREEKMEKTLEDIKFSRSVLTMFTRDDGFPDVLYSKFDEDLFQTLVVLMERYDELKNAIKAALITVEKLEKNPHKAMTIQEEALKFFRENFCDIDAKNQAEN